MNRLRSIIVIAGAAGSIVAVTTSAWATFPGSNRELAYLREGPKGTESYSLRTIYADGSQGKVIWPAGELIHGNGWNAWPAEAEWSPDGTVVALIARGGILGYDRLLIGDPETGERHVIHRAGENSDTFFASIAFSPTGDRVLFCAVDLDGPNDVRLFTIALDGSDLTLVSDRPACFADWSSTNQIVASAGTDLNKIVTMNPNGSGRHVVVPARVNATEFSVGGSPSWSPDGSRIAYSFTVGASRQYELFSVAADGTARIRLTDTPGRSEFFPVFSPDGTLVAFTRSRSLDFNDDYRSDLFTVTSDGSTVQRLTDTRRSDEYSHSWRSSP
jgi:Tol biopolymer transport system component